MAAIVHRRPSCPSFARVYTRRARGALRRMGDGHASAAVDLGNGTSVNTDKPVNIGAGFTQVAVGSR